MTTGYGDLLGEILQRFPVIKVMGEPTRVRSTFVRGYSALPVRIPG